MLALIQPALPVIDYLINYDYIVTKLCENRDKPILSCNGKCYLEKQVTEQQNIDHKQPVPQPPKIDFKKIVTFKYNDVTITIIEKEQKHQDLFYYMESVSNSWTNSLFRPPIV